ncbi:MAG TPA: hypothetical protein PKL83_06685 [bacterium]|nr:hypothetical protein [bacterium]
MELTLNLHPLGDATVLDPRTGFQTALPEKTSARKKIHALEVAQETQVLIESGRNIKTIIDADRDAHPFFSQAIEDILGCYPDDPNNPTRLLTAELLNSSDQIFQGRSDTNMTKMLAAQTHEQRNAIQELLTYKERVLTADADTQYRILYDQMIKVKECLRAPDIARVWWHAPEHVVTDPSMRTRLERFLDDQSIPQGIRYEVQRLQETFDTLYQARAEITPHIRYPAHVLETSVITGS